MEKKVYDLIIDPDLRDLIPPLTDEEHQMLEESIVRDGCDTPLTVWNNTIVDGHNRYEICRKHSIPFAYEEKDFADKEAVMFWMLEHQLARRNLEAYQRAEIMLKYAPILRKDAARRQATSTGGSTPQLRPNLAEAERKPYTRDKLAKMAGVSHGTLDKVKVLDAKADEDTKKKLRTGEISIHRAYTDLMNKEHEGEFRICGCCGQEKPYSAFRIPSKSIEYCPICKECEMKAKQAAKEAEERASQPAAPKETGIHVKEGKKAHVCLGLPDDPAMFDQVVSLLKHAQNAYLAAFGAAIGQYHPSMVSEENNDIIHQMIDYVAEATEELLDSHLNEQMKEEQ